MGIVKPRKSFDLRGYGYDHELDFISNYGKMEPDSLGALIIFLSVGL